MGNAYLAVSRSARSGSDQGGGGENPPVFSPVPASRAYDFIDSQGSAKLAELNAVAEADGVTLRLARVKPQVVAVLDADGLVATLGADRVHGNVDQAIEAQLAEDDARHGSRALSGA